METDYARWEKTARETPMWDERNKLIASLIPENVSVIDVGAGNMTLRSLIPASCRYQSVDCVKVADDTLLVDFNKGILPEIEGSFDLAICSGVMEYVESPKDFLRIVTGWANLVILTYATLDANPGIGNRRQLGWFNDLSYMDLIKLISEEKIFMRHVATWQGQVIFELKR
jgi:hypothetical protein